MQLNFGNLLVPILHLLWTQEVLVDLSFERVQRGARIWGF